MAARIPPEIWKEIFDHLPSACLQRLYAVNRAFFQLALDEKYREVRFEGRSMELLNNVRYLSFLSDSFASKRVQSLVIHQEVFNYDHPHRQKKFFLYTVLHAFRRKKLEFIHAQRSSMLKVMTKVTSLEINFRSSSRFEYFLPMLDVGLVSFGSNLSKLILDLPIAIFQHAFLNTVVLPKLQDLDLTLKCVCNNYHYDLAAPFVNNHYQSLSSLLIRIATTDSRVSDIFLKLRHFPLLTKLTVGYPWTGVHHGLQHMLTLHKTQLRQLILNPRSLWPRAWSWVPEATPYQRECFEVEQERLCAFHIGLEIFSDIHRTSQYLSSLKNTLTSLVLADRLLSYQEVDNIISALSDDANVSLKHLTMAIDCLSPQLLVLLAANLPDLDTLRFKPAKSVRADYPCTNAGGVPLFHKTTWKLCHFRAKVLDISPSNLDACKAALREALPMVKTVTLKQVKQKLGQPIYRPLAPHLGHRLS